MTDRPFISMCMIAADEADNVKRCFDSFWPWVDEVVLIDTGDGSSQAAARKYAQSRDERRKLITERFEWTDDFSKARNFADKLASGHWLSWIDLDDTVEGFKALREQAEKASSDVTSFFCSYDYAQDADGNTISELVRERLSRAGAAEWTGRLHEHKLFTQGHVLNIPPEMACWHHHRDHQEAPTGERNLRILEGWDKDEPNNPRILQSLGMEYMGLDRHDEAIDTFRRYLKLSEGEQPERRAQAYRHMAVQWMLLDQPDRSKQVAFEALAESTMFADTHLSLAEAEHTLGNPQAAYLHAKHALELGKPQTIMIVNPQQYDVHPRALMALALAQLGRFDEAVRLGSEALSLAPSYQLVGQMLPAWRASLQREQTVQTWLACEALLREHGELEKAFHLVQSVPWFAGDDVRVIQRRSELRRLCNEVVDTPIPMDDDQAVDFMKRFEPVA